jgi:preprotein translocase subunit SecD/SecD/SecF fusion protein
MDPKQRNYLLLALCAILVIGSWVLFIPPNKKITQGLDIQGGLSVILTAKPAQGKSLTTADMDRAELIVRNRVDKLGASETSIQRQGSDSILVQIPGIKNAEEALKVIGSTGQLEFVEVASITDSATLAALRAGDDGVKLVAGTYKPFMTGEVVKSAGVSQNSQTGQIEVNITMNAEGSKTWAEATTRMAPISKGGTSPTGEQVAIVLDGVVKSAPSVNEPITGGQTAISGKFTAEEAKNLKTVLETGALPVTLEPVDTRVVGPTLGQDSLRQGVLAALVGLALVGVYLIAFYRGLGVISVVSLLVFSSMFLGLLAGLSMFGLFALSLPGIAGIVLTIGLAADSSILINERVQEEIGLGKTYRSAAASGTRHAIGTSVDADLVTFVSALALFAFAIGPVRGFALTLMLGIVCDLLMMLLFKRPLLMLLAENIFAKSPAFWGVPKEITKIAPSAKKKGGAARA